MSTSYHTKETKEFAEESLLIRFARASLNDGIASSIISDRRSLVREKVAKKREKIWKESSAIFCRF